MLATAVAKKRALHRRRRLRIRKHIVGTAARPRLCICRSLRHLTAQFIDDAAGRTLAHVTTDSKSFRESGKKSFRSTDSAKKIGEQIGKMAKDQGITACVFDRSGNRYHGVIKAFAEAVRAQGVKF
jgi:large subunit ribosomal protein L18